MIKTKHDLEIVQNFIMRSFMKICGCMHIKHIFRLAEQNFTITQIIHGTGLKYGYKDNFSPSCILRFGLGNELTSLKHIQRLNIMSMTRGKSFAHKIAYFQLLSCSTSNLIMVENSNLKVTFQLMNELNIYPLNQMTEVLQVFIFWKIG